MFYKYFCGTVKYTNTWIQKWCTVLLRFETIKQICNVQTRKMLVDTDNCKIKSIRFFRTFLGLVSLLTWISGDRTVLRRNMHVSVSGAFVLSLVDDSSGELSSQLKLSPLARIRHFFRATRKLWHDNRELSKRRAETNDADLSYFAAGATNGSLFRTKPGCQTNFKRDPRVQLRPAGLTMSRRSITTLNVAKLVTIRDTKPRPFVAGGLWQLSDGTLCGGRRRGNFAFVNKRPVI